jgi:hypothetical protein
MTYNNYFPGCVWVRSEDVSNYYVSPNCTIPLWDINEQIIYLKSADGMGKPTVKILEYTIREDSESSELTDMRNEIANLKEQIESLKKGKKKNEPLVSAITESE